MFGGNVTIVSLKYTQNQPNGNQALTRHDDFTNQTGEFTSPGKMEFRQRQHTTYTNEVLPTKKQWRQAREKKNDGIEKSHHTLVLGDVGGVSFPLRAIFCWCFQEFQWSEPASPT